MSGECRKGGVCPPAQSTKLKIIYGLKVSKIADLDAFIQSYTYSVYGWWLPSGGAASFQGGGKCPPPPPPPNETLIRMYKAKCKQLENLMQLMYFYVLNQIQLMHFLQIKHFGVQSSSTLSPGQFPAFQCCM